MQIFHGRFAIIGGTVLVALANVILFKGVDELEQADKISLYGSIYIYALIIPIVSVLGIFLASYLKNQKIRKLIEQGLEGDQDYAPSEKTEVNWWILGGSFHLISTNLLQFSLKEHNLDHPQDLVQ